jgi:hypothetical protein
MTQASYLHFRPPNSDFLVHWTGRDLDKDDKTIEITGAACEGSVTNEEMTRKYLDRLKSILRFGLWMKYPEESELSIANGAIKLPRISRTCFTELKLSEVRSHGARYGRLGIGFKRPYVMFRGGLPVWYCPSEDAGGWMGWLDSLYLRGRPLSDKDRFLCFLKPMGFNGGFKRYTYLYESEWRIIYADWLERDLLATNPGAIKGWPEPLENSPPYLLPVDGEWLALIIYPSIQALCAAQQDKEIRQLLRNLKSEGLPNSANPTRTRPWERYTMPVELDLDSCRNF